MLSRLVLEDCCRTAPDVFSRSANQPVEAVLGHCAEIWRQSACFVRWNHLCRCLHMSFCPLTNSNSDPKVRHLWERSCGKRFRECSIIPGLHKQSFKKRQRVHHLVGWLKSCRCTSPIKKEKPILAWRCRGGSRGCSFMRLTAAMLYKSYSVQIF